MFLAILSESETKQIASFFTRRANTPERDTAVTAILWALLDQIVLMDDKKITSAGDYYTMLVTGFLETFAGHIAAVDPDQIPNNRLHTHKHIALKRES